MKIVKENGLIIQTWFSTTKFMDKDTIENGTKFQKNWFLIRKNEKYDDETRFRYRKKGPMHQSSDYLEWVNKNDNKLFNRIDGPDYINNITGKWSFSYKDKVISEESYWNK